MIPKYYTIKVCKRDKINLNDYEIDYYYREGFKEEEIKNIIEKDIRDNIWKYILENDIQITIE